MSTETVTWALRIEDGFSRALDDAASSAKRLGTAAGDVDRGLDSMRRGGEKIASMVGGPIGDLADIVFDVGEAATGAGSAVGGLGVALGGASVAVAALAFAGVSLASSAADAADRLRDAGLAAQIPAEAQASVDRYRDSTETLRSSVDLLTVSLGGPAMDAVGNLALALVGAADAASRVTTGVRSIADEIDSRLESFAGLRRVLLGVGTLGASEIVGAISGAAEAAIEHGQVVADQQATVAAGAAYTARALEAAADAEVAAHGKATAAAKARATATQEATAAQIRLSTVTVTQVPTVSVVSGATVTGGGVAELDAVLGGVGGSVATPDLLGGIAKGLGGAGLSAIAGGGPLGGLAAAGPVGLGVAAVVGLPDAIDGLAAGVDSMTSLFEGLPEALTTALGETLPAILRDLPDLAVAITEAALSLPEVLLSTLPEIVAGLVAALPELVIGVVQALIESLPQILMSALELTLSSIFLGGPFVAAVAEGLWEGFQALIDQLPEGIANALQRLLYQVISPLSDTQGRFLGTDLRAEGGMSFLGVELPSFDRGSSEITRDGLALLHRGERIERDTGGGGGGGSRTVTINVNGVSDPREVVRLLYEHLGRDDGPTFAFGDRLGGG